MSGEKLSRAVNSHGVTLIGLTLLACVLLFLTILNTPIPEFDLQYGETSIKIAADRGWTLFPGDCVNLTWELEGIKSLYIEREGKIGWGEMPFCPEVNATSPRIEVTAPNGIYRRLDFQIHHLPDLLLYLVGFVGLIGSFPLAAYYLFAYRTERPMPVCLMLIGALLLAAVGGWLRLRPTVPTVIDEDNGDVAVRMWAEHDRIVFPHECVDVRWSVVGAKSLIVNGNDYNHSKLLGKTEHCPGHGDQATLEAVTEDGASYSFSLVIATLLPSIQSKPFFLYWTRFGLLLGGLVFVPLCARMVREGWQKRHSGDFVAVGGCVFLVFILYLPFGFDSSGHWEEWHVFAYYEGGPLSVFATENVSRFFAMAPHSLAYLVSSESFIGYHLVHFALYSGKMILLYGILRQLKVLPLYAILIAVLFMVFPVNSGLMSLRSLPMNFSMLSLLAAIYSMLIYIKRPGRLTLVAVWLALLYNVGSNETGYAVILVVPLLWWLRSRSLTWRNVNLTAVWYIVPALKFAFIVLLKLTNRGFYQGPGFDGLAGSPDAATTIPGIFVQVMAAVYPHTFIDGWREAFAALGENRWWPETVAALLGIAAVAWYLARTRESLNGTELRRTAKWLLGGLLFVIPAVGVLMWVPYYRGDPWRMYFYVPIGASVALFSAIVVLAEPIRRMMLRQSAVVVICLILMAPAMSRLFLQHDSYIQSSKNKAWVLYGVVETVPAVVPTAKISITTELDRADLRTLGIFDFVHNGMLDSVFHVIYPQARPDSASFCLSTRLCGLTESENTVVDTNELADLLQRTLVFRLNVDLSVDLIEDPAAFLGLDIDIPYDASQLYDADAPLPPRATTMLGAALRD